MYITAVVPHTYSLGSKTQGRLTMGSTRWYLCLLCFPTANETKSGHFDSISNPQQQDTRLYQNQCRSSHNIRVGAASAKCSSMTKYHTQAVGSQHRILNPRDSVTILSSVYPKKRMPESSSNVAWCCTPCVHLLHTCPPQLTNSPPSHSATGPSTITTGTSAILASASLRCAPYS